MTRLTANDFHPEVLKLFDRYVHGLTDRRGFLEGAKKFAAGGVGAALRIIWRRNFPISRRPFRFTARSRRRKMSPGSRRRC